jgi:hypothetical protein
VALVLQFIDPQRGGGVAATSSRASGVAISVILPLALCS